ncbi:MAG: tripartite tricarboxylate transporter TctB family protein [Lawsonibacter sp.]|jgi:putative tricarboxylic transport membrane protein
MKKAKQDMLSMAVLMAVCASFYFWFIPSQIRVVANSKTNFTSRTFPSLLMAALFLVALLGFINAVIRYQKAKKAGKQEPIVSPGTYREIILPLLAFVLILIYALLFKYVGYLVATILFVPALLLLLRCKDWRYYVGGYGFCAVMYLIFIYVLRVPLP